MKELAVNSEGILILLESEIDAFIQSVKDK
jgi:hypothetical protein